GTKEAWHLSRSIGPGSCFGTSLIVLGLPGSCARAIIAVWFNRGVRFFSYRSRLIGYAPAMTFTPKATLLQVLLLIVSTLRPAVAARAAKLPESDQRAGPPRTLNTLRAFPEVKSKFEWQARAREIREQVLVSCGLWPLPEKTPLRAAVFGKIE